MNLDLTSLSAAPLPDPAVSLAAPVDVTHPTPAGADSAVVPFTDLMGLLSIPVVAPSAGVEPDLEAIDPDGESLDAADETSDAAMGMPAMAAMQQQLLVSLGLPMAMATRMASGPSGDAGDGTPPHDAVEGHATSALVTGANGASSGKSRITSPLVVPGLMAGTPLASALHDGAAATSASTGDATLQRGTGASSSAVADVALSASNPSATEARRVSTLDPTAMPAWLTRAAEGSHNDGAPALTLAPTTPAQWRQPLADALGDRLQFSLQRGFDQAVIRLDPPQLGRIEIAIRHEAGALQVHMTATHGEVVRQLNAIGDSLRQDLGQRQYGEVSVTVSDAGAGRDAEGRPRGRPADAAPNEPGRALAEAETGPDQSFRLAHDLSETP